MAQARKHEEWNDAKGIIHTIDFVFNMNTLIVRFDLPSTCLPAQSLVDLINTTATKYRIAYLFRSHFADIECG